MSDYKSNNEYLREIAGDESGKYHTNNYYLKQIAENGGGSGGSITRDVVTTDKISGVTALGDVFKNGLVKSIHVSLDLNQLTTGAWTLIGTIPEGYRPYGNLNFNTVLSDGSCCRVVLYTNGDVKVGNAVDGQALRFTVTYL